MHTEINEYTIANEIALLRDVYHGSVLLVEGASDGRLMEKLKAPGDHCRVVPAFGKERALKALKLLRERALAERLLVMVDADYWRLTGDVPTDPDIVVTDFHDIEMDIAMSAALDAVVAELANKKSVAEFERSHGAPLREVMLAQLAQLSVLKYASHRQRLPLKFSAVEISEFIDEQSAEIDTDAYLRAVLDASPGDVALADVLACGASVRLSGSDLPQAVRGHDFTALLAIALRHILGSCPPGVASADVVETMFRLAFGREHLERSDLYRSITDWQDRSGGVVLA